MAAERIDVLAVMDSDRGDAVMARAARYKAEHAIALERRSVEARDAVAELIEANERLHLPPIPMTERNLEDVLIEWKISAADVIRLSRALARVQGEGA